MNHEMHDAAFMDPAECLGLHLQKSDIVRQEVSGDRLKNREQPGKPQADATQTDQ